MSQHRASSRQNAFGQLPADIFDRIDSAVIVIDRQGTVRHANAPVASLLKRPLTELVDTSLESVLPARRSFLGKTCARAIASRHPITTFGWDTFLNAWIGVRIFPIVSGIEAHVRTIPSGESESSDTADIHADVSVPLDAVTIPMQIVDAEGLVQFANQAAIDLLGYPREELIGKPLASLFMQPAEAEAFLEKIRNGKALDDFETEMLHRDGQMVTVQITLGSHESEEAQDYVQCYLRDVTAERMNEERGARLAALVDASDDAIIAKRLDGIITSWNPGAERIYGYTAEEAVGQPITLIMPKDREGEFPEIMRQLAMGQHIDHYETVRQTRDGRRIDVSVSIAPVRNKAGRIVGASTIARDITEQRMLDRKQREFLTMVAHDLRSPLTSVKGFAQLMQRRETFSPSAVEAILSQVRHMERLIGEVLDITRLDENRQDLTITDTDLVSVTRDVLGNAQELRRSGEIRLEAPSTPMIGKWDEHRLSQVLDNLVSNALKYAPEGDIVVTLEPGNHRAVIRVADQGPGIDPDHLPYIFDRFYRTPGDHAMGRGVGLGLAITKGLVEAHGGRVDVRSTLGVGTTFTVRLPWDATIPTPPEPDSQPEGETS